MPKKSSPKGGSSWIKHVKHTYHSKKKSNPSYKYSQAMKDAKKTFKKG